MNKSGIDLITATENLRIATANRDIALNSVNVMKTYVASVEATLVTQQSGGAAHYDQYMKHEAEVRDAAVIRVKADTLIEAADKIAAVTAKRAAFELHGIDSDLYLQQFNATYLVTTTHDALALAMQVRQDAIALQESTHSAKVQAQQALHDFLHSGGDINLINNPGIESERWKLQEEVNRKIGVWQDASAARVKAGESQTFRQNAYNQAVADAIPINARFVAEGIHQVTLDNAEATTKVTWENAKATLANDQLSLDTANGQIQVASIAAWKDLQATTKDLEDSKAILVTRQAALATEQALVDAAQSKSISFRSCFRLVVVD